MYVCIGKLKDKPWWEEVERCVVGRGWLKTKQKYVENKLTDSEEENKEIIFKGSILFDRIIL